AALKGQLARRTVQVAWAGLLIVLLALMRPLARRQIRRVGEKLSPRKLAPIVPTVVVLLLTLVCASLWPVLLWMAGWLLSWPGSLPVVASVGLGLMRLAPVLVPMVFLGEVCRPMGLAEAHLRWSNEVVRSVRRYLWMWNVFVVPALGLALIFDGPGLAQYESAAGRFSLMFSLAGMAVVGYRITRSQGPVMRALRSGAGSLLFTRLQWVWFPITGLLPGALVVAVALGFQYGSLQVALGLIHSATLIFPLLVVRGVVRRWLSLARLRLALEQLQRRREAEAEEAGSEPEVSGEIRALADEPDERDVGQIDEQAMRLVDVTLLVALSLGLMVIWADLLPALGGLRRVELWQSKVTSALADGSVSTQLVAVSLADVLGALLLAGLTVLATGNLPGLLEMTVLRRMTLEPGGGYAITTICRYLLTAGGVIGVASLLGITWDSVQWLAAAVSVGLGFGLQEIFANFVSGLIILFERPIRVGDIITVGGIEGVVTRIRTRATTIRDRDRRELLVPNKEFITGQLVNWTLSDPISRLILPVGIAYGSDTALAERTLIEVASAHPMVLESPIPNVVFRNFGDSTLDYELRVFIADRDFWPNVTHELNTAIHQSFAERGLEIAFPQRDLHLRDGAGEILGDWAAARRAVAAGVGQADESKEPNTD
ncbi:MAG: potassium efflux system protein, partial [Pseudohongiellaceae bacterium]